MSLSRRDFLKTAGLAALAIAGGFEIQKIVNNSEFSHKHQSLRNLIDADPSNTRLKDAYSALILSHIAIAGGRQQQLNLPADNLYHYIYGQGSSRNISYDYTHAATKAYGSMETYMSETLSFGLNAQENIKSAPDFDVKKIGFRQKSLPDLSQNQIILVQPNCREISYALGRHTLTCNFSVNQSTTPASENVASLTGQIEELQDKHKDYKVIRFFVTPTTPIHLYDRYYFSNNLNQGAGFGISSPEVGATISITNQLYNLSEIKRYMGEGDFDQLMLGEVDIKQSGLKTLEDVGLAHSFDTIGSFTGIREFPLDIIIQN